MKTYVINLESTPERLAAFNAANKGVIDYCVFPAVDGRRIPKAWLLSEGHWDGTAPYSQGAMGAAISQFTLWQRVHESGEPATICEDDAILHRQFHEKSTALLKSLGGDWDLVYWGWNFDSVLVADIPNLGRTRMGFNEAEMRLNAHRYLQSPVAPNLLKLVHAFGSFCYSISPAGAQRLLSCVRPLHAMDVFVPGLNRKLRNISLDVARNAHFKDCNGFVSFPPLALTPNDKTKSTIYPSL